MGGRLLLDPDRPLAGRSVEGPRFSDLSVPRSGLSPPLDLPPTLSLPDDRRRPP